MRDAWRLAVGTLTALPIRAPASVDRTTSARAMLLAPVAVVPLALGVLTVLLLGAMLDLPPFAVGLLAVGLLALGTRCLHWDGLSDVADGLTASYDPQRSLAVMRTGTSGPAGTVAVVIVIGLQASEFAALSDSWPGAIVAAVVVALSRCALWIVCARPVPSARPDGLGSGFAGTVPAPIAVLGVVLLGVLPGLVVLALVRRCVRRLGGATGDVFGAAIEIALATSLLSWAWIA